jgi:small subunit ribosomal protein S4
VSHGHVSVSGRRVTIPSYLVKPGQWVALDEALQKTPDVQDLAANRPLLPAWLERQDGKGRVLRQPDRQEIEPGTDEQLIVEFYSR